VERATRDAYAHALIALAETNPNILVLDSDLSRSTRTDWFQAKFPQQFINAGIAEANMVGMGAGLAAMGFLPFLTTYSIFIGRAFDQIRQAIAFANLHVVIVATHSGLSASHDGGSHQGLEATALMRCLPNMTVVCPCDYDEAYQAIIASASHAGPSFISLGKFPVPGVRQPRSFSIGPAQILRQGHEVSIIGTGAMTARALTAAELLGDRGVAAEVVHVPTLKPLDTETILSSIAKTGCGVVAEEHFRIGGLYSAICESVAGRVCAPLLPLAMNDTFGETGEWHELLDRYRLSSAGMVDAAMDAKSIRRMAT
jgi:transketolase